MCNFSAKIAKYPNFIQLLLHKRKQQKKELDEREFSKRRRLLETQVTKNPLEATGIDKGLESIQADEFSKFLPDCMETNNNQMKKEFLVSMDDGSAPDMSENLIGEGSGEDTATSEKLSMNNSKIYLELEDSVNWKPCSWSGFRSELVEQTGC